MRRLSIIIPALGDWEALETTLAAVLRDRPTRSEVLVVTNEAYADPYDLRGEVEFIVSPRRAKIVELVNDGAAAADGEVLHVLCCGATVEDGWTEPALRHFGDPHVAAVAPLVLASTCPTKVVSAGYTWSSGGNWARWDSTQREHAESKSGTDWLGPELVAGFYRRSILAELGGFDEGLPAELAAIDYGLRCQRAGYRSLLDASSRLQMDVAALPRSRAFVQGWHSERVFWRHLDERRRYRRLAAHAAVLFAETVRHLSAPLGVTKTIGRMLGSCDRRRARRRAFSREAHPLVPAPSTDRRIDAPHDFPAQQSGTGQRRRTISLSVREETT